MTEIAKAGDDGLVAGGGFYFGGAFTEDDYIAPPLSGVDSDSDPARLILAGYEPQAELLSADEPPATLIGVE